MCANYCAGAGLRISGDAWKPKHPRAPEGVYGGVVM